jgi:hypothetical protein
MGSHRPGDRYHPHAEVINRLLNGAVDRTEEKAVFDRWDEQISALFRNPTFMPAVRSVARRLEERITLSGFDVAEIVEAVEARGSRELPTWWIAGQRDSRRLEAVATYQAATPQRRNARDVERLD